MAEMPPVACGIPGLHVLAVLSAFRKGLNMTNNRLQRNGKSPRLIRLNAFVTGGIDPSQQRGYYKPFQQGTL